MASVKVISPDTNKVHEFIETYAEFCKKNGVLQLYLFGSWANSRYSPYSDLDFLLVVKDSNKNRRERSVDFMPTHAPVSVDVFVYTLQEIEEGNDFAASVLKNATRIF